MSTTALRNSFIATMVLGPFGFCIVWKYYDTWQCRKYGWRGLLSHFLVAALVSVLFGFVPSSAESCVTKCCEVPSVTTAPSDNPQCFIRSSDCDTHRMCHREACECTYISDMSRLILLMVCGMSVMGAAYCAWRLGTTSDEDW